MRDAARMLARNRQEMIANELSRLAGDEYLEDIMQHMRHMEVRRKKDLVIGVRYFLEALLTTDSDRTRHYPMLTSSTCNARSNGSCGRISLTS